MRKNGAQQVHGSALRPVRTLFESLRLQARVHTGGRQESSIKSVVFEDGEDSLTKQCVLTVCDAVTENRSSSLVRDLRLNHDRTGHNLGVDVRVDVGRVDPHVGNTVWLRGC